MKAMRVGSQGELLWVTVPDPTPNDDEVLIEVHAAGVNRADLLQRAGQYPPPPGWPDWLGIECSGIIRTLGSKVADEGRWQIGDPVCALLGGGGYAEYVAVPAGMLMPIPKGLSIKEAAALPEAFGAAYLFLFTEGQLKSGDTLLMQAGASGLASVLIPMAKSFGARVITTVLSDEIANSIKHLSADLVVNTSKDDLSEVLKTELEAGRGVDIAIDCLGDSMAGKCLPYLNRGGRWIMIATLAGDITEINLRTMYVRGTRLIGTTLRSRTSEQKRKLLSDMVRIIWPKIESGEVRPTIYRMLPMDRAEEAHTMMREGKSVGKLVLTLR